MSNRRRSAAVAAAAGLALMLAGCGVRDLLPGSEASASDTPGAASGQGSPPSTLAPQLLDCDAGGEQRLALADVDLGEVTWDTPAGFEDALGYIEENPVEDVIADMWVAKPARDLPSLNVVTVVRYEGLDWGQYGEDCGAVPLSAVGDRLAHYRDVTGAAPLSDAEMTEVGDYPAMHQSLEVPRYSYEGYWLFSTTQLLHIYCQWTDDSYKDLITSGCTDLVESVRMP